MSSFSSYLEPLTHINESSMEDVQDVTLPLFDSTPPPDSISHNGKWDVSGFFVFCDNSLIRLTQSVCLEFVQTESR